VIEFVGGPWDGEVEPIPGVRDIGQTICVPRWGKRPAPTPLISEFDKWVEYRIVAPGIAHYMGPCEEHRVHRLIE
jgi:hypothetical protein